MYNLNAILREKKLNWSWFINFSLPSEYLDERDQYYILKHALVDEFSPVIVLFNIDAKGKTPEGYEDTNEYVLLMSSNNYY